MLSPTASRKAALACFSVAILFVIFGCEMLGNLFGPQKQAVRPSPEVPVEKSPTPEKSAEPLPPVTVVPAKTVVETPPMEKPAPMVNRMPVPLPATNAEPAAIQFGNNATTTPETTPRPTTMSTEPLLVEAPDNSAEIQRALKAHLDSRPADPVVVPVASIKSEPIAPKKTDTVEVAPLQDFASLVFQAKANTTQDKEIQGRYRQLSHVYTTGSRERQFLDLFYARFLADRNDPTAFRLMDDVQAQIRASLGLKLRNLNFIKGVRLYGDFDVRDTTMFPSNTRIPVYAEVLNFASATVGDQFISEVKVLGKILNANGDVLQTFAPEVMTRKSASRLNDFHFCYQFTPDKQLPISAEKGYTLELTVEDTKSTAAKTTERLLFYLNREK